MASAYVTLIASFFRPSQLKGLQNLHLCAIQAPRLYSSDAAPQNNTVAQHDDDPEALSENDKVSSDFFNCNPRNLENMNITLKDKGWGMSNFHRKYWHMLHFEEKSRHTEAYVEHRNGFCVLSASTKEWAIRKFLYSTSDVAAAHNIGRVLAQRCIQSGINFVCWETKQPRRGKYTVEAFIKGMTDQGVVLEEPETYTPYTKPDDYFPEYLGEEHEEEIQNVRKQCDTIRECEFTAYDEQPDSKANR